eukprot:7537392-Karenia_brevis.AAC.1
MSEKTESDEGGPKIECITGNCMLKDLRMMFKDPEMNPSLSKEKKQAQRITTSRVIKTNDDQSGTTACMPEEGSIRDEEAKKAH